MYEGLMVSVSGVRGRVGEALTPEVVATLRRRLRRLGAARAGGSTHDRGRARQPRVGPDVPSRRRSAALQSVGCDVIDIGLTTTPTCQLAVEHHHAAGGLMISASHNPIEWNALKFIGPTGLFLEAAEGAAMRALVEQGIPRATWDELGDRDAGRPRRSQRHIERVLAIPYPRRRGDSRAPVQGRARLRARRGRDHHAGAARAARLRGDGDQPGAGRPLSAAAGAGRRRTSASWNGWCSRRGADIGFAVDPDVDRLALVSDDGTGDRRGLHAGAGGAAGAAASARARW